MNIYLYGNCQMGALGQMMLEQHPEWTVISQDVSTFTTIGEEETAGHLRRVTAADVVVAHPMAAYRGEPKLSIEALRGALGPSTQLLTMPSIVFEGTHGAFTYLENRLGGYFMPYHNCHVIDMGLRGYRWKDVCTLLHDPELYTAAFVTGGMEASLNQLRSRESVHDTSVKVSPLLEAASSIAMNTINHPRRSVLAPLLNELYACMSVPRTATERGEDYLRFPFIPPLPSVLHHLGLPDAEPLFQTGGYVWTREAYIRGSLAYYARLLRQDLVQSLSGSRGSEFLQTFYAQPNVPARATSALSGTTEELAQALVEGVFSVLLGRPVTPDEVSAHVASLMEAGIEPWLRAIAGSTEFKQHQMRAP